MGHDLNQGMIGDGIFEMSKGVGSAELPAGLSVVRCCTVVSHYQGYRFNSREGGLPAAAIWKTIENIRETWTLFEV